MFLALQKYSVTLKDLQNSWFYKEKVAARLMTFDTIPALELKDSYPDRIAVRSRDYLALMIALYQSMLNDGVSDLLQEIRVRWAFSRDDSRKTFFALSSREAVLFGPLMALIGEFLKGNLSGPMQRLKTHHESFEEALRYASLAKDAKIEADAVALKTVREQLAASGAELDRRLAEQAATYRAEMRVQLAEQAAIHSAEKDLLALRLEEQAVKFELKFNELSSKLEERQTEASTGGNIGGRHQFFSPVNGTTKGYSMVFLKLSRLPKLNQAVLQGVFQGKDGVILVENTLYILKQSEQCLQEIPATEDNRAAMVHLKTLFVDENSVLISKPSDLILVTSLLDDGLSMVSPNRD